MIQKLIALFSAPRFQAALVIGVLQALVLFNVVTSEQGQGLILIIQSIIGYGAVTGTVDKLGEKKVEAAKIQSGISPEEAKVV